MRDAPDGFALIRASLRWGFDLRTLCRRGRPPSWLGETPVYHRGLFSWNCQSEGAKLPDNLSAPGNRPKYGFQLSLIAWRHPARTATVASVDKSPPSARFGGGNKGTRGNAHQTKKHPTHGGGTRIVPAADKMGFRGDLAGASVSPFSGHSFQKE